MAALTVPVPNVHYQIDPKVYDNITKSKPFLNFLMQSGRMVPYTGRGYVVNIHTSLPTSETFDPTSTSALGQAVQSTKMKGVYFDLDGHYATAYGLTQDEEERQEGPLAVIKASEEKHKSCSDSHADILADDAFNGTGASNSMRGLDVIVSPTTSVECGNLDADADAAWNSQTTSTATVLNQLADINAQIEACTIHGKTLTNSFTTETLFTRLLDVVGNSETLTNNGGKDYVMGADGFVYRGIRFEKDEYATANALYLIPGDGIKLLYHPDYFLRDTGLDAVDNVHQYRVGAIKTSCNLVCKERRLFGGFTALTVS